MSPRPEQIEQLHITRKRDTLHRMKMYLSAMLFVGKLRGIDSQKIQSIILIQDSIVN